MTASSLAGGPPIPDGVKLVACRSCHAQFDVSDVAEPHFDCRCGATVRNETHAGVDAAVQRCAACGALLRENAESCDYCQAAVLDTSALTLSLLCPECFARNAETAKFCTGCGVEFRPEPLPSAQDDPIACPACDETLAVRGVGGVWVRECGKCNGLWAAGDRFDSLVARALEAARQRAASGVPIARAKPRSVERAFAYRSCPVCKDRMTRKNYGKRSGVIVDWCGAHGTWLDADELEQIAAFIAGGGLKDTAPGAESPGLSSGPKLNAEQFKAMVVGERLMAEERARAERRSVWTTSLPSRGASLLDFLSDLLK